MTVLSACRLIAAAILFGAGASPTVSFARTDVGQCNVIQRIEGGTLEILQEYDRAGAASRYELDFEADEPTKLADGSRFRLSLSLFGQADFADSAAQRLDDQSIVQFDLATKVKLERPAFLVFSRGNYINIDLGAGKVFLPGELNIDGDLETLDTYSRWVTYAEEEHILTWVLQDVGTRLELIDSGTIDLNVMRRVRDAALTLVDRIGKQDIRTAGTIPGLSITCL